MHSTSNCTSNWLNTKQPRYFIPSKLKSSNSKQPQLKARRMARKVIEGKARIDVPSSISSMLTRERESAAKHETPLEFSISPPGTNLHSRFESIHKTTHFKKHQLTFLIISTASRGRKIFYANLWFSFSCFFAPLYHSSTPLLPTLSSPKKMFALYRNYETSKRWNWFQNGRIGHKFELRERKSDSCVFREREKIYK